MDLTQFVNPVPYPNREDFKETVSIKTKSGNVIEGVVFDEKAHKAAIRKYIDAANDVEARFRQAVIDHLGIADNPKRDLLFEKAWSHGHAGGFNDVLYWAEELVDLIL